MVFCIWGTVGELYSQKRRLSQGGVQAGQSHAHKYTGLRFIDGTCVLLWGFLEHTFYWRLVEIIQREVMGNSAYLHKVQTIIITRLFIGTARQERLRRLGSNASAGIWVVCELLVLFPVDQFDVGVVFQNPSRWKYRRRNQLQESESGRTRVWCMEISFGQRHTCVKKVEVYPRDGCRNRHQDQHTEFGPNPQVVEVTIFFFGLTVVTGHFQIFGGS